VICRSVVLKNVVTLVAGERKELKKKWQRKPTAIVVERWSLRIVRAVGAGGHLGGQERKKRKKTHQHFDECEIVSNG